MKYALIFIFFVSVANSAPLSGWDHNSILNNFKLIEKEHGNFKIISYCDVGCYRNAIVIFDGGKNGGKLAMLGNVSVVEKLEIFNDKKNVTYKPKLLEVSVYGITINNGNHIEDRDRTVSLDIGFIFDNAKKFDSCVAVLSSDNSDELLINGSKCFSGDWVWCYNLLKRENHALPVK